MNVLSKAITGLIIIGLFLLQGCLDDNNNDKPLNTGVMVVNAGNFGDANGSLSFYDEKTQTIENYVVKNANGGSGIGAGIESIYGYGNMGIILCNGPDKLEYIDLVTMKYLSSPTTAITTPRYMAVSDGIGYISCWGPWSANWTLDESYVAVLNTASGEIVDSLQCGSGPEGVLIYDNKLYIANAYDSTITVYNLSDLSGSTISLEAAPQHMIVDANDILWVSVTSGYGKYSSDKTGLTGIDIDDSYKIVSRINIKEISEDGTIAYDHKGHNIYLLTAQAWPGTQTEVRVFDTGKKELSASPLVSGENFSGLNFNSDAGELYVADAAGFQGNGKIMVYDKDGNKVDEQTVAIGPTFFMFQ